MKLLKTIKTVSKIKKTLRKIESVFSIIGILCCAAGIIGLVIKLKGIKIGGVKVKNSVRKKRETPVPHEGTSEIS